MVHNGREGLKNKINASILEFFSSRKEPSLLNWILPKTYNHECRDGSVKIVHRNVDDAFPFHLKGWKAKLDGNVKIPVSGQGGIKAEYEEKIHGLLFGLDDLNQGLTLSFRAAYVAFQADPCAGHAFLLREVSKILREQQRLQKIRIQIDGLITLAKNSRSKTEFLRLYMHILNQIGSDGTAEVAVLEIKDATLEANKLIGVSNAS